MRRQLYYRLHFFRRIRKCSPTLCCLCVFLLIHYLSAKLFYWETPRIALSTRLHPDEPLDINLRPYSVCHPKKLYLENITSYYHQYSKQKACFLIQHLNGGPWWSYITHEFAEILRDLKKLGIKSDIKYRPLSFPEDFEYFLKACHFDENLYIKNKIPIIILLWDVNSLVWYKMGSQWNDLFQNVQARVMAFIDDLHFTTKKTFYNRQYLFENIATEIFSTYPYIFHNYYNRIPSSKLTWLPHAASTLSYRSINYSAENILFVSGADILEWYPCRARAYLLCRSEKEVISCLKHPGYAKNMKNSSSFFYGGRRYFSYMKQYVFGLATCQTVQYAVAKLFELPANGLALVTTKDLVPILEKLHLYHNEHFLTIQCLSVFQLRREILHLQNISKEEVNNIRIKSQNVVYERHMTQHRAELLHVRLLAQALMATTKSDKWNTWGRDCD
jgi:hypothetical protein